MSWFTKTLTSSIGRKLMMALTGLFLITFLIIHASGNLQLLANDGGKAFNLYTKFMTTSPIIKTVSYILYTSIIVHVIWAILLTRLNVSARPQKYEYDKLGQSSTWASRSMMLLGTIILIFLVIHMKTFWFVYKFGEIGMVTYDGVEYKDLYTVVVNAFKNPLYTGFYVVSMVFLAFHLAHGFWSGFQTLGLNHKKYTPLIKTVGLIIAIVIPVVFAIQPVYVLLFA
ncbi:succinate dehydrogenase cytochrome b subunit [Flexithrix dorotheae]|uniref:succinate dehydrogenase cytochrome b subunit n=1 Tax=Flexithrix dorotheae TaxID=70993 RepID=UPI0009FCA363|nr:succinate dehydrogenase cytochrome b subunit [Flexithrix dorotheae]